MPGISGTVEHSFNPSGYGASHRVTRVDQLTGTPTLGATDYSYHPVYDGSRWGEWNAVLGINGYRSFEYDHEGNATDIVNFLYSGGWGQYVQTNAYDAFHRRAFKWFTRVASGDVTGWYMSYDPLGRLTEIQYFPYIDDKNVYQTFQLIWIGDRLVGYWQTQTPGGTTSKRYVGTDETGRPIDMLSWPSTGDATREWWVNPFAWGEMPMLDGTLQPILFAGQYSDDETRALMSDGATTHRPGLVWNGYRTYDPFTGSYLQVDPLAGETWSSYVYVDTNPVGRKDPDGRRWDGSSWDGEGETIVIEGEVPEGPIWLPTGGFYPSSCFTFECLMGGGGGGGGGPNTPPPPPPQTCKKCMRSCAETFWIPVKDTPKPDPVAAPEECGDFPVIGGNTTVSVPCAGMIAASPLDHWQGVRTQAWGFTEECWETCRIIFDDCF